MHDLDRTTAEWELEDDMYEREYEYDQDEYEYEDDEYETVFDETEEMELAAELLDVTDDEELDLFIGSLLKKAKKAASQVVRSPVGKHLGGMLKQAAKQALPQAGAALGSRFGMAGLGKQAGSALGQIFGLELEGMSGEDQEFEAARQFVRFAGDAVKNAASGVAQGGSPQTIARKAVVKAAQEHAPGLLQGSNGAGRSRGGRAQNGRWTRKGNQIVLHGV